MAAGITPAHAGKRELPLAAWAFHEDHPRVCGEKFLEVVQPLAAWGSPPRVRGKEKRVKLWPVSIRITPACAGKSSARLLRGSRVWDHPRVCGEKDCLALLIAAIAGSPPRVRGKAGCSHPSGTSPRITPAYAGKSVRACVILFGKRDHPRVCGEKLLAATPGQKPPGSPPRMRGKEDEIAEPLAGIGITPAYAGKSFLLRIITVRGWDHPRVCGEKGARDSTDV